MLKNKSRINFKKKGKMKYFSYFFEGSNKSKSPLPSFFSILIFLKPNPFKIFLSSPLE